MDARLIRQVATAVAGMGVSPSFAAQGLHASRLGMANEDVTVRLFRRIADTKAIQLQVRNFTESALGALGDGCWETASPAPADSSSSGDVTQYPRRRPSTLCGVLTGASLSPDLRKPHAQAPGVFYAGARRSLSCSAPSTRPTSSREWSRGGRLQVARRGERGPSRGRRGCVGGVGFVRRSMA